MVTWTQTANTQVPSPGFLIYPGGLLSTDPSGDMVLDGTRYRTSAQPYLYGGGPGAGTYDWQRRRWLPSPPRSVSPDGLRYAYPSEFGAIHIVDVLTGADRNVKALEGPDTVLYYAKEGVYFIIFGRDRPDPGSGSSTPIRPVCRRSSPISQSMR